MNGSRMSMEKRRRFCELLPYMEETFDIIIGASPSWIVKLAVGILRVACKALKKEICE